MMFKVGDLVRLKSYCKFSDRVALVVEASEATASYNIKFVDNKIPREPVTALGMNLLIVSEARVKSVKVEER